METCLNLLLTHTYIALGLLLKNKAYWNNWSNCLVFKISIGQIQLPSHLLSEDVFWFALVFHQQHFLNKTSHLFPKLLLHPGPLRGTGVTPSKSLGKFCERPHRKKNEHSRSDLRKIEAPSSTRVHVFSGRTVAGSQDTWRDSTCEDPGVKPTSLGDNGNHCTGLNETNE